MTVDIDAPDIPDPTRKSGGRGYPSAGAKLGPAWRKAWGEMLRADTEYLDGRELANEVAADGEVSHETVLGILARAARAGMLLKDSREVTGTRGIRRRVFYRINPDWKPGV